MGVSVVVEIGAASTTTWSAITCQVFGLGWARGATEDRGVLAVPEAGSCAAYLIDPNRDLDPGNSSGAYAGVIDVGARFRITLAGVVAFVGRIENIEHDLNPPKVIGTDPMPLCRLAVSDAIARMSGVTSTTAVPFPAEQASTRIGRLLDIANVATGTGQRDIEAGGERLQQASGLVNDAWSDALAIVQNELGSIDFRPNGTVVFRTRTTTWTPGAPVLSLGCDPGALDLDSLRLMSDRTTVRNRVDAARAGSTAIIEEDAASQTAYGLRSTQRHDLVLVDDAAVDAWALFTLRRAKKPTRGYEQAQVRADAAAVAAIEAVPLFTGRVALGQDDYGPRIDAVLRLLGVAWEVDELANATATLVLGTDTPSAAVARTYAFQNDAQWIGRAGNGFSVWQWPDRPVYWEVWQNALRVSPGAGAHAPGGLSSFVLSWSSSL